MAKTLKTKLKLMGLALSFWKKACQWEGITPDNDVVVWSESNPYRMAYYRTMGLYFRTIKGG